MPLKNDYHEVLLRQRVDNEDSMSNRIWNIRAYRNSVADSLLSLQYERHLTLLILPTEGNFLT